MLRVFFNMKIWQKLKTDPKLFEKRIKRQKLIQDTRNFFIKQGFREVETPVLKPSLIPESYLEVFKTDLLDRNRQGRTVYLSTSPESSLKKLLSGGIGNCFEVSRCFRNTETQSKLHNPEFTMIEWYRVGATYEDIMSDCEQWLQALGGNIIFYNGRKINISPPWERISVSQAFRKYAHIDLEDVLTPAKMFNTARKKGYQVDPNSTWEQLFNQIYLNEIEKHLGTHGKPTIIYDYPSTLAALSRLKADDPRFAERFEFYIGGLELGDCYTELTDPKEQKKRFQHEQSARKQLGKTAIREDNEFIEALKAGLPPCAGIAVGLDRLAMLFTDSASIDEVLYFPASEF